MESSNKINSRLKERIQNVKNIIEEKYLKNKTVVSLVRYPCCTDPIGKACPELARSSHLGGSETMDPSLATEQPSSPILLTENEDNNRFYAKSILSSFKRK